MTVTIAPQPSGDQMDLATALDDAIAQLRAGVPLEQCLVAQPAFAADLRPLLEVAQFTMQVAPAASLPGAKARVRAAVLDAAQEKLARRPWWDLGRLRLRPAGFAAAGAAALLALGGSGAMVASANALPGEPLYPVKLATEDARLAVARAAGNPEAQVEIHTELAERRIAEAQALVAQGRPVPPGIVESALRQADAADRVVAQLPEPKRAQAAAKLDVAQDQRTSTLSDLQQDDHMPLPAKTAIAHAVDEGRQKRGAAAAPARANTDGSRAAAATSSPTSAPRPSPSVAQNDDRDQGKGNAKDDGASERRGQSNGDNRGNSGNNGSGGDEGRGRPAAAAESSTAQPGVRDAVLAVATAVGQSAAASDDAGQGRAGQGADDRSGPPPALPRQQPPESNRPDDNQRGNGNRGRDDRPSSDQAPAPSDVQVPSTQTPTLTPPPHADGTAPPAGQPSGGGENRGPDSQRDNGRNAGDREDRGNSGNSGGNSPGGGRR